MKLTPAADRVSSTAKAGCSCPNCSARRKSTSSRARRSTSTTPTGPRSGARRAARRAPPLPRISTTRRSALLGAHPRMIEPIEQIFGEKLYMHQFKINAKAAFTGDVWQWHQDYGTWKRDDGMPEPRAMNIAIFLDEVMPINGPLMLVPQSQTRRRPQGLARPRDHVLSAVDAGRGDRDAAGQGRRHRRADRQGRRHADVPRQSGARLERQHHALPAQDRVSDAECGLELHPHADAAGIHRASRFHADPDGGRRRAGAAGACASRRRRSKFSLVIPDEAQRAMLRC